MLWLDLPSDLWMSLASPHSVEGICHKSVALSADFSKEKVYQGLCDWRIGALPIQNSLGSWGCAESSLPSHLCCQSTYPSDSGQGRNIPRLNIFESFLCTFVSSDLTCVHPVARECAGEILISVFSSGERLLSPHDRPSCLFIALASRGTAPGSFLQAEPLLSVSSALRQANFHLFGASFFLCASFILLTFLLLPVTLLGFYTMPMTTDWGKKKVILQLLWAVSFLRPLLLSFVCSV